MAIPVIATAVYIDGSLADLAAINAWPERLDLRLEGVSTLTLMRRGGPLAIDPDPLMGKPVRVEITVDGGDPIVIFQGVILDRDVSYASQGYACAYQARCLRNQGDTIPFIDANTLTSSASYNYPAESEYYFPSRSGMTVGEIIQDCLEMATNAAALDALGIGGYTVAGDVYTLPASTLADLALLDKIPSQVSTVSGPRCLSAIESFLQSTTANYVLSVQPDGTIRFYNMRAPTEISIALDDCDMRANPPSVRRSLADVYTKLTLLGQSKTVSRLCTLQNGGLEEYFGYGAVSSAAAKAAWTPEVYKYGQGSRSVGTCTITDSTHVVVTSVDPTQVWDADAFDQTHQAGILHLSKSVISGVDSIYSVRVVANTALTAGGSSTLTLESALPALDYDGYNLYGFDTGPALVYRRYRIVDADMRAALARKFHPPAVWVGAYGGSATATDYPMASVCWAPYNEVTDGFAIDIEDGTITFYKPTYMTANNSDPTDVRVLIALNVASLTATAPSSGFEGTGYTVDGFEREQRAFQKSWTDPANQVPMEAYAQEQLDACKDAMIDLSLSVARMFSEALPLANQGLSLTAAYDTGLETANIPISGLSITWNSGEASIHSTSISASNRRQPPGDSILPPERQRQNGYLWGPQSGLLTPFATAPEGRAR